MPMIGYGQFATAVVSFLILAFVIYRLVKAAARFQRNARRPRPPVRAKSWRCFAKFATPSGIGPERVEKLRISALSQERGLTGDRMNFGAFGRVLAAAAAFLALCSPARAVEPIPADAKVTPDPAVRTRRPRQRPALRDHAQRRAGRRGLDPARHPRRQL